MSVLADTDYRRQGYLVLGNFLILLPSVIAGDRATNLTTPAWIEYCLADQTDL
jgi:hypothetical protein